MQKLSQGTMLRCIPCWIDVLPAVKLAQAQCLHILASGELALMPTEREWRAFLERTVLPI